MLVNIGFAALSLNMNILQIVSRDSARLGLKNELAVGIADANHITVCKFDHANSQKYRPVWKAIKELADSAVADSVPCMLSPEF
jgi:hypothetical protein